MNSVIISARIPMKTLKKKQGILVKLLEKNPERNPERIKNWLLKNIEKIPGRKSCKIATFAPETFLGVIEAKADFFELLHFFFLICQIIQ